jgi:hypothetical protein
MVGEGIAVSFFCPDTSERSSKRFCYGRRGVGQNVARLVIIWFYL